MFRYNFKAVYRMNFYYLFTENIKKNDFTRK